MRARLLLAGSLFLAFALACGTKDPVDTAPEDTTTEDTAPPDFSDYWWAKAEATCGWYFRCETAWAESYWGTVEVCTEEFAGQWNSSSGGYADCTFNQSYADQCVADLDAMDCKMFQEPLSCQGVFYCP